MASLDNEAKEIEHNKQLFYNRMSEDGQLVSPIDLSLDAVQPVRMDALKWTHMDVSPVRMKLTNSGETVIVSAKWATERPYLTGGPLKDSYVFSQIHFHWGADEHEGSEHTVQGICYPMEMHIVFYKTRYLTQEAALKQGDGVIIVVVLIKVANKTATGVRWLVSQLDRVVQPCSSTPLPLSPLSALVLPFSNDYLVYWGSLQTSRCAHTMMWLVSRAALGITVEDLGAFRGLFNSRKEKMNKNFRGSNPQMGRTILHINPTKDLSKLLHMGVAESPGQPMVVNFTNITSLSQTQLNKIFSKGDRLDHSEKLPSEVTEPVKKEEDLKYKNELCGLRNKAVSIPSRGSTLKTNSSNSQKDKTIKRESRNAEKAANKSRLPVLTHNKVVIESSLKKYFQRPDSVPGTTVKGEVKTAPPPLPEPRVKPVTKIPRPIGRIAKKISK